MNADILADKGFHGLETKTADEACVVASQASDNPRCQALPPIMEVDRTLPAPHPNSIRCCQLSSASRRSSKT
jgi:hypothetical protein